MAVCPLLMTFFFFESLVTVIHGAIFPIIRVQDLSTGIFFNLYSFKTKGTE